MTAVAAFGGGSAAWALPERWWYWALDARKARASTWKHRCRTTPRWSVSLSKPHRPLQTVESRPLADYGARHYRFCGGLFTQYRPAGSWPSGSINGILSGDATIAALAHPVTVIATFFAAPLTSQHHWRGLCSGGVRILRAKVRLPTLRHDVTQLKGWWQNRVPHPAGVYLSHRRFCRWYRWQALNCRRAFGSGAACNVKQAPWQADARFCSSPPWLRVVGFF